MTPLNKPIFKQLTNFCLLEIKGFTVLCFKILENLMYKTLINFIDKYNILFVNQFGFREKHFAMYATLLITDKTQRAIEDGQFSCGSFLDFSKAFDTVDHSILIRKLSHCGIMELQMV